MVETKKMRDGMFVIKLNKKEMKRFNILLKKLENINEQERLNRKMEVISIGWNKWYVDNFYSKKGFKESKRGYE